ncbi:hypothetical protein HMPREF1578_01333 [Gardnerella pickettii JCP8017B]|nr:hypothetical protein HMPREF1578_01333 [Gardnerella pickettii JCP8017B]
MRFALYALRRTVVRLYLIYGVSLYKRTTRQVLSFARYSALFLTAISSR